MATKAPRKAKAAKAGTRSTTKARSDGGGTQRAAKPVQYCSAPPPPVRQFSPEVLSDPPRQRAIIAAANKWVNNTVLHYAFFKTGSWKVPAEQATVVRRAFKQWQDLPIGVKFVEVNSLNEAEVRIGYSTDGSWSYLGRDVLGIPLNERTMSFGWPLNRNEYGLTTAIHEIGHTLGMPHEHQNPFAGIVWDEPAVYAHMGGPPNNWDPQKVYHNVLRKLDPAEYRGSDWDPDSVMEYQFPAGLITTPVAYQGGIYPPGAISPMDRTWATTWYPTTSQQRGGRRAEPQLRVSEAVTADLAVGEQIDYVIRVDDTRQYTIASFGAADTMLGLFEDVDGESRFLAGDDDSGTDRTANITARLRPGRTYHVRLRVVYKGIRGTITIMYW